jgi:Domain of unknown function (DUF6766)/Isochorismatase family
VILTGIAGNICVLFTANDAYMRDFKIFAPADYIVSNTAADNDHALRQIEFLQMAVFVLLTTFLIQKGSPESRRPGVKELVDTDPRDFTNDPEAPWPVRRGGWILRLYEHSLGLAFVVLFLLSWTGHALGGFSEYAADEVLHHQPRPVFTDYLISSRFWFESFQNWQSEFLAIASMVWLAVYLRQRWSPESKPVHAPHAETGR